MMRKMTETTTKKGRGRPPTLEIGIDQRVDRPGYNRVRAQILSILRQLADSGGQHATILLRKDVADAVHIARSIGTAYVYDLIGERLVVTPAKTKMGEYE